MTTDVPHPSLPPRRPRPSRYKGAIRVAIIAVALLAAAAVAVVIAGRLDSPDATELALARVLQPGTPLAEVTAHLRRLGVPFTIDSTAEGTIVSYGRKVAQEGRGTSVTDQQIIFDAQDRLRDMRAVTQITLP
jgi:hypothetical protein